MQQVLSMIHYLHSCVGCSVANGESFAIPIHFNILSAQLDSRISVAGYISCHFLYALAFGVHSTDYCRYSSVLSCPTTNIVPSACTLCLVQVSPRGVLRSSSALYTCSLTSTDLVGSSASTQGL
jgi:hypothetical protein